MNVKPLQASNAASYLNSVRAVVTPQRFAVAVDAIFRKAEADGDLDAFKAVAPYVVGPMRYLEEDNVDDTISRILAVVERRRELIGGRKVLEGPVAEEIDGEYTEIGGNDNGTATENSRTPQRVDGTDANTDSSADGEGFSSVQSDG